MYKIDGKNRTKKRHDLFPLDSFFPFALNFGLECLPIVWVKFESKIIAFVNCSMFNEKTDGPGKFCKNIEASIVHRGKFFQSTKNIGLNSLHLFFFKK